MDIRNSYNRNIDIISDYQSIYVWKFESKFIKQKNYSDYSLPIKKLLFKFFYYLASSNKKFYRLRHFTVWLGDAGPPNNIFCMAIPYRTSRVIIQLLDNYCSTVPGHAGFEFDKIPYVPLIPVYRYEYGKVVEYCYDEKQAGRYIIDDKYNTGLTIQFREWISAEDFNLKQRYGG